MVGTCDVNADMGNPAAGSGRPAGCIAARQLGENVVSGPSTGVLGSLTSLTWSFTISDGVRGSVHG